MPERQLDSGVFLVETGTRQAYLNPDLVVDESVPVTSELLFGQEWLS